jgi:hypothetical protein
MIFQSLKGQSSYQKKIPKIILKNKNLHNRQKSLSKFHIRFLKWLMYEQKNVANSWVICWKYNDCVNSFVERKAIVNKWKNDKNIKLKSSLCLRLWRESLIYKFSRENWGNLFRSYQKFNVLNTYPHSHQKLHRIPSNTNWKNY